MIPGTIEERKLGVGRRACAQLVRAVSSSAASAPLRRAAAGSALAQLHALLKRDGYVIIAALQSFTEVCTTVSALVEVYSVSLREVATLTPTPGPCAAGKSPAQPEESKDIPGAGGSQSHAANYGQQRPGSDGGSRAAASGCDTAGSGTAAGHGAGPSPEDWVPLLVDSSALVANCLNKGISTTANPTAATSVSDADLKLQQATPVYICSIPAVAAALLHTDALPALSRLLSAEVQRGPARALLTPSQLATCLQPLNELIAAAGRYFNDFLPVSPQRLRQPQAPAPNSLTTTTATSTAPDPSPPPPTPAPTSSTSTPPAGGPSDSPPAAAAKLSQGTETCIGPPAAAGGPGGSAAAPVPRGHEPATSATSPPPPTRQAFGPALLRAVADSGAVEAACRAAVGAVEQGAGGRQQRQQERQTGAACVSGSDREQLLIRLLELPRQVLNLLEHYAAAPLPQEPLRTILAGPCMQVRRGEL